MAKKRERHVFQVLLKIKRGKSIIDVKSSVGGSQKSIL
jgi:hypothetical protein